MPTAWIRSSAEALSAALSGGRLPRVARKAARRLLAQAFDAIMNENGDADLIRRLEAPLGSPCAPRPLPALARAVEDRLRPPRGRAGWRVGVRIEWAGRAAIVERLAGHGAIHDRIVARIDAVLATFQTRPAAEAGQVRTHRLALESERDDPTLTRG